MHTGQRHLDGCGTAVADLVLVTYIQLAAWNFRLNEGTSSEKGVFNAAPRETMITELRSHLVIRQRRLHGYTRADAVLYTVPLSKYISQLG